MRKFGVLAAVALVTVAAVFVFGASAASPVRIAKLSGAEEVPGPGDEDGAGRARVTLNATAGKVCFNLRWRNIDSPTMAHIHTGRKGVAGDIVVDFFTQVAPLPGTFSRVGGCVTDVDATLIRDIKRNPRTYYVNIHNEDFPGGAIRGQLSRAK